MSSVSNNNPGASASSGSVAVFAPVAAPILRSLEPIDVAKFLKERERYEVEIEAKKADLPSLKPLPYTASIDRSLLKQVFVIGKLDTIAPDAVTISDLTDDNIKAYIKSLIVAPGTSKADPTVIKKALQGFSMPMNIEDADARTHLS